MQFTVKRKIIGLAVLAALLPVIVVVGLIFVEQNWIESRVKEELDILSRGNLSRIALDVQHMCAVAHELAQKGGPETDLQQQAMATVRQAILKTPVGKEGYVFVIGSRGENRGRYIISKDGARDGENIWEAKDADGRAFIQSIVGNSVGLHPGVVEY